MPQEGKPLPDGAYLRVRDWDKLYEINRTRELKKLDWVPVPNKQDGDGYSALVDHPDAAAHYGCWMAILLIASKCEPRGTLIRDNGEPHTPQSLARISRLGAGFPQAGATLPHDGAGFMAAAIERLVGEIGWLEVIENNQSRTIPHQGAVLPQAGAGIPQDDAASRARAIGKGTEGKGREVPHTPIPATPSTPIGLWVEKLRDRHPTPCEPRFVHTFCQDNWHRLGEDAEKYEFYMQTVYEGLEDHCRYWAEDGNRFAMALDKWLNAGGWKKAPPERKVALTDKEARIKRQEAIDASWEIT